MRRFHSALYVGSLLLAGAACAEVEVPKIDGSLNAQFNDAIRNYVESAQKAPIELESLLHRKSVMMCTARNPEESSLEQGEEKDPQRFVDPMNVIKSAMNPSGKFFDGPSQDQIFASMIETLPVDEETYDFIVVGGGASGCALANALSEAGINVLLLERGMERTEGTTPKAMNIHGAGSGLADPTISQIVGTAGGIRTFSGAVMGGGSSINIGIAVAEKEDFFVEMAKQFPGFNIDYSKLREAYEFVAAKLLTPMPTLDPFGSAYKEALHGSGFHYWENTDPPQPSLYPQIGYEWQGLSFFDHKTFKRNASDALLDESPFITVKTRHTVRAGEEGNKAAFFVRLPVFTDWAQSVTFVEDENGMKVANCVVYRPTRYSDIRPMGDVWSFVPSSNGNWAPWIGIFIEPSSVLSIAGVSNPFLKLRKVCLSNPGQGRIVLSAGAIHTPLLLFRSENDSVGTFGDRMFLTIPAFMQNFSDEVAPSNPNCRVRRLSAGEEASAESVATLSLKRNPELVTRSADGEKRKKLDVPDSLLTVIEHEEKEASPRGLPLPAVLQDLPFMAQSQTLRDALQPRISQFMGLQYVGPNCGAPKINERNLGCSLVPIQELSGDRTAEGFIYATRFIFPTSIRSDPLIDTLMEFLQSCAELRAPFGVLALKPACALAQPLIMCFRRVVAPFYFTSEPKSRGFIKLKPDGNIHVNPKYLADEQDLFDAVRGVTTLIEELNSGNYNGVVQPAGPTACPVTIANGLLDLVLAIASSAVPVLKGGSNLASIQTYLQGLLPVNARRMRRLVVLEDNVQMVPGLYVDEEGREFEDYSPFVLHEVDEAKLESLGLRRRLEAVGFDFASFNAHHASQEQTPKEKTDDEIVGRRLSEALAEASASISARNVEALKELASSDESLRKAIEACQASCSLVPGARNECPKSDMCCVVYGNAKCQRAPGVESFVERSQTNSASEASREEPTKKEEMVVPPMLPLTPLAGHAVPSAEDPQVVASYPPTLPNVNDPHAVAVFAKSYMTSLGHLYGSAQMGKVVDDKFRVVGVEGLSIVDASILPQLTRMNPAVTLIALGRTNLPSTSSGPPYESACRYAGQMMLEI